MPSWSRSDGYLATALVRAGDLVEPGQVLATLDDRDLRLDQLRAEANVEEQRVKYDEALGKQDRVLAKTTGAALEAARAALVLADSKVTRTVLRSTLHGTVVTGDLSQMLGSPIEKGKTLFEVAPLDNYRVALQIAGSDIAEVAPGETGIVILTGLTNHAFPITITAVTPVAAVSDGQNTFRVEGSFTSPDQTLRPGMEGVGKVEIGRRRVLEIWSRPLLEWIRMMVWAWRP